MTLKQLAQESLEIQDACNLQALANRLPNVIKNLKELGVTGTDELREHPIVTIWIDKLKSLCTNDIPITVFNTVHEIAFPELYIDKEEVENNA